MGFRRTVMLVVSDNDEWVGSMQRMLGATSYIPVPLTNSLDALSSAESLRPELILLDLDMKTKNALSVARSLKGNTRTKDIPLILASSYLGVKNHWRTSFPYIDSWVRKPFGQKDIIMAIEKVLYRRMGADLSYTDAYGRIYAH